MKRRKINKKTILKSDKVFTMWESLQVYTDDHAWDDDTLLHLGTTHAKPGETLAEVLKEFDRPLNRLFVISPLM